MTDKTIQASFRGVPFGWEKTDDEFGRRGEHHVFPGRDKGYFEDLGGKDQSFTIEAFIGGKPNFESRRDALIRACKQPGPGELVHPHHGVRQVVCTGSRVSYDKSKRWLAVFQLTFLETGSQPLPTATADNGARVRDAGGIVRERSLFDFSRRWTTRGQPDYVANGLGGTLGRALGRIQQVSRLLSLRGDSGGIAAGFAHRLPNLAQYLYDGPSLGQGISNAFLQLGQLAGGGRQSFDAYSGLWTTGNDWETVPQTTRYRAAQAESQDALAALFRRESLVGAAIALADMQFDSYDEAVSYRDRTATALELEQQTTDDMQLYGALGRLRADTVRDVSLRATDLSRVTRITRPATLPALRIAYELYGDASRADELIARNRLRHGGFVPGGTPLEVRVKGAEVNLNG